jgi:hydrogenase-4 transcriptional activator
MAEDRLPEGRIHALLLDVWREAGRHIELEESFPAIAGTVARFLGLAGAHVLIVPRDGAPLVHAQWRPPGRRPASSAPADVPTERTQLERSLRHAAPLRWREPGGTSWSIALRLDSPHLKRALLIVRTEGPEEPDEAAMTLLAALREPLSAALEHDARVRELELLRAAAEADRQSALTRLGRDEFVDTIVGRDRGLRRVIERVALVARSDVPVLILGETGTGKELVAREIHQRSARAEGPFLRVNCGAIPSELVDSELFGHEKGAFTGATTRRRGWFERADGGTLLLDEIGELPLAAQVRFLRVLQEGTFERVGGERPHRVDVRIVASTHRDLPRMIAEGAFREDLWYRVGGFPLLLPPLRDRAEDIGELAEHFALRAARRFGLRPVAPTPSDVALLLEYAWPGNVRELQSVIERAAILGDGQSLEIGTALRGVPLPEAESRRSSILAPAASERVATLDEAMRNHIERALQYSEGRVEGPRGAANLLGINPHTLRGRMRKLGIEWARFRKQ